MPITKIRSGKDYHEGYAVSVDPVNSYLASSLSGVDHGYIKDWTVPNALVTNKWYTTKGYYYVTGYPLS